MKYDLETKVKTKRELIIFIDDETGAVNEQIIPAGTNGVISSQGRSSVYDFKAMYDVEFDIDGEMLDVTFFEKDLEEECYIMSSE